MILIMPDNLSVERRVSMTVYGAQLILTETAKGHGMEYARDLAFQMQAEGKGKVLNQFGNTDNPLAHIRTTGPEIWRDTHGQVTHFVSAMGTTGTITGTSTYLKSQNPNIQVIGVQPSEGSSIAGIRKWPIEYLPTIFKPELVDREIMVTQADAEEYARQLARQEGIFAGISSGGALWAALQLAREVRDATIVFIVCDRGDRYLSQGIF
jgi:cysteine synthase B